LGMMGNGMMGSSLTLGLRSLRPARPTRLRARQEPNKHSMLDTRD
jgi:hypothetical protein